MSRGRGRNRTAGPRRRRWLRLPPERGDTLGAALISGALGAGVGLVSFYLARLFLAREPLDGPPGPPARRDRGDGREGGA